MITFILSFIREFLGATKNKLYINQKDTLGAITLFFIIITSETMTPIVLGIPITYAMALRILGVAIAGFCASLLSTKLVSKALKKYQQDKPYQFTIKFKLIENCEFVEMQLREQGIKTVVNKNNKTLKAISLNKENSKIIKDTIEGKFKNYSVNEFVEYRKK